MALKEEFSLKSEVFDWLETICVSIIIVLLCFTFAVRTAQVSGSSMYPTLKSDDRVLVANTAYGKINRGDVVVITQPTVIGHPLIKRVIGIEGDTVNIDFDTGRVFVNGIVIEEDYIFEKITDLPNNGVTFPFKVSPGHVFVMGDNRNNSTDSREKIVGEIDTRYILGKAFMRVMPFKTFGTIK